jgi:2-polyprenyl-3-methyl-5-hydroxy-6-metoxy-1,4-benzoquinol methylase
MTSQPDVDWPAFTCPDHRVRLTSLAASLACPEGHAYPIVDGIPRFVASERYAAAFGRQWLKYATTQLDTHTGRPLSADRARRCLGEDLWSDLQAAHVLEAGCGAGRFTEILLARGARVTSVDLSLAVEADRANFPPSDRHRVAQCDITHPPFANGTFDVVFCLGVIQHTPDPETTIGVLYSLVRPSGWLVFDHYAPSLSWVTKTAPLARAVLKRLPPDAGMKATERMVHMLLPLHRAVRRQRILQMLLSRISPVLSYYHAYPELTDDLQSEWALLDTHDSLTAWYRHTRTPAALERVLARLGATQISCRRGGNGVEARARKPARSRPA